MMNKQENKTQTNSGWQFQRIHQLTSVLGMDREAYEEMLINTYDVRSSKDMTPAQRHELIGRLTEIAVQQGVWQETTRTPKLMASTQAIKRYRFHSLWCAVRYADLPAFVLKDGRRLEGPPLRAYLIEVFDAVKTQPQRQAESGLPKSVSRYLSTEFVNPLSNRWLAEGGFRSRIGKASKRLYTSELSSEEVKYLTSRWREFQRTIESESGSVDVPVIVNYKLSEN